MNDNANNRFKNFLVNGFQVPSPRDADGEEESWEMQIDEVPAEEVPEAYPEIEPEQTPAVPDADDPALRSIESELIRIRYMLEDLLDRQAEIAAGTAADEEETEEQPAPQPVVQMPDLSAYMTTREQQKAMAATVAKLESSAGNKNLVRAMEQVSTMREDFLRLCRGMRPRIAEMDPETVLSSFEAYCVDMENILTDGGVYIGSFDYDKLNTLHQRIVGVVPTGEKEKDGTIAERQSDGYKLGDKVLLKEKVTVYKYDPSLATPAAPEVENPIETTETPYETVSESGDSPEGEPDTTEEKE